MSYELKLTTWASRLISNRAGPRHITLITADDIEIEARHVVFCTGYEMPKIVPTQNNSIRSTWAMATAPQPDKAWPQRALIWEASETYLYARVAHDGRIICGGEDETYSDAQRRDACIDRKIARIGRKLGRLFPALDTRAEFAWAGSFGSSTTGTPTIGEIPGHRHCYAVLGYGGNGITFSMLAATLLTKAILGKKDPDAKLFEF
jgi:glycine/D-amino acid oxidase-like deaminating enzyme